MSAISSDDWRITVSSKPGGTRFVGLLALGLGVMLVIAAGGMVLTNWRDWPVAVVSVVLGGLFAAGGVHFLRRAGKPMFEIDPTGLTYHPLDDISWKTERIPWERVRKVRCAAPRIRPPGVPVPAAPLAGEYVYFDYEEAPIRNWFTRAYDLMAGRRPGDPEPLAHAALPLMLSSMPEDELFQLLEQLSRRHGFALELAG
ncbi:MAG TPA: hypothetical protein VFJ54_02595 [Actinomycetota bacterium]|nr:hypothetical protein [Actinomycetota bacterium]